MLRGVIEKLFPTARARRKADLTCILGEEGSYQGIDIVLTSVNEKGYPDEDSYVKHIKPGYEALTVSKKLSTGACIKYLSTDSPHFDFISPKIIGLEQKGSIYHFKTAAGNTISLKTEDKEVLAVIPKIEKYF